MACITTLNLMAPSGRSIVPTSNIDGLPLATAYRPTAAEGRVSVKKDEFQRLFLGAIAHALARAEKVLGASVPRTFDIKLHGCGVAGEIVSPERAVDLIYLDEFRFFR